MSDSNEYVVSFDIGCEPDPSGSGEIIIQSGDDVPHTFVIFQAISTTLSEEGLREDLGVAVVECVNCSLTKYGYPNDEGMFEHPLFSKGLDECGGVGEVINSTWKRMLEEQMETSARRIWGDRYHKAYNIPPSGERVWDWKHFIIDFKEGTFECIADDLTVTLSRKTYKEILSDINMRILGN